MRSQRWRVWWWGGVTGVMLVLAVMFWVATGAAFWGFEGKQIRRTNHQIPASFSGRLLLGSRGSVILSLVEFSIPANASSQTVFERTWRWHDPTGGAAGAFVLYDRRTFPKVSGQRLELNLWTLAGWSLQYPTPFFGHPREPTEQAVWSLHVPMWMVALFLTAVTLWPFFRWRRARRYLALGPFACPKCGYDLRASPDRCPECGTPSKLSPASRPL